MTTTKAQYIPLFIVLTITLMAVATYAEDYTVGLGVSDYEARPRVTIGQSLKFEVARVSNEGTLNLTITPIYVPDYNATLARIIVVFTPNTTTLAPQEDVIIYGEVTEATETGSFNGTVEFKTTVILPPNTTGNPSTPGGSAKVFITIIEIPPDTNFIASLQLADLLKIGLPTGISVATVAGYLYIHRSKTRRSRRPFQPTPEDLEGLSNQP